MFDAAARHSNFRLASEELHLTQGAVAQQVRKLESDLGQPLFLRQARGLILTEAGIRFHRDIRRALEIIDRATAALRPAAMTVTLSVPPSLASKWLVPRLAQLSQDEAEISLNLRASESLTDFRRDAVDLAIRQGQRPDAADLVTTLLAPLDLRAVASPGYLADRPAIPDTEGFASHKLIEDGHRSWAGVFADQGLGLPVGMLSFNQTALAVDAAIGGQGVALAPQLLVSDALRQGQLIDIWQAPKSDQGYYLLHPNTPHPARDRVIDWLLTQI